MYPSIVSHSHPAHVDDWFALGVLTYLYPNAPVVRSRDPEVLAAASILVDVGGVCNPRANKFDHHNVETGHRDNGVPYASAGLVWAELGQALVFNVLCELGEVLPTDGRLLAAVIQKDIDDRVVTCIDAADTGFHGPETRDWAGQPLSSFFNVVKTQLNQTEQNQLARSFIVGLVAQSLAIVKASNAAWVHPSGRILVFDHPVPPDVWQEVLKFNYHDTEFVVSPGEGQWNLQTVPHPNQPYPSSKKKLPPHRETEAEFDVLFAHSGRFFVAARSREQAVAIAEWAMTY